MSAMLLPNEKNEYYVVMGKPRVVTGDRRQRTYREVLVNLTVEDIAKHICETVDKLHSYAKRNRSIHDPSFPQKMSDRGLIVSDTRNWDTGGSLQITQTDSLSVANQQRATQTVELFEQLAIRNLDILGRIQRKEISHDDWFAANIEAVSSRSPSFLHMAAYGMGMGERALGTIQYIRIVDALPCALCGEIVYRSKMDAHLVHPECNIRRDAAAAEKRGLARMEDFYSALAIREAGIKSEIVATRYDIYAPEWVKDAIKTYHTNEGYADMTLAEFLHKMNPDT